MGWNIENYSLNELHRISVPGRVAPSLFWVLPVGNWQPNDLDEMWRWFTEGQSKCKNYGLLLVKEDMGRRKSDEAKFSIASVGAELADLMPDGTARFADPSAYQGKSPKILVLAGNYPQPGWATL